MSSGTVLPASVPRCAAHPEAAAGGTCPRCGGFFCPECATPVLGVVVCAACARRPEVNYIEALRQKLWGRRDAGAWVVGAGSLLLVLAGLEALLVGEYAMGLALGAWAAVGGAFFLGLPWAPEALLVAPLVLTPLAVRRSGPWALVPLAFAFSFALSLRRDTRTRLFFRREVSSARLQRLWEHHSNNPLARHALTLGQLSFLLPLLAPAALVLGVVALRRVDPSATPPVGRAGHALLALLLASASLVLWDAVFWPALRDFLPLP